MSIRYIAYCRKSTDEKDKQVLSIDSQIAELKEFARRENLEVLKWIVESKTAKVPGRPKFEEVMELVEKGVANGLLGWHPDRLARNSVDGGRIIYMLDSGKLQNLKFPTFWFENTPQGKFMLNIAFGQSKYYVDNLSENVARGMRQKLKMGVWPGKAPLGYFNDFQTRTIKVNEKESIVVKQAFEMFAKGGHSYTDITNFLAERGVVKKDGKPFKITRIHNILTNPFYIGVMKMAGEKYQGKHETFISKRLFSKVQDQVRFKSKPKKFGHNFTFTGLIKCKDCGAAITAEQKIKHYKRTNRTVRYVYYHCTKRLGKCPQPFLAEDKLVTQLKDIASSVSLPTDVAKDWHHRAILEASKEQKKLGDQKVLLSSKLKATEEKADRLLDLYLEQNLPQDKYKTKQNELFDEKKRLEEKLECINNKTISWFGPFSEFLDCALQAQKIARKENTNHQLKELLQKVGSNFFLDREKIYIEFKSPYASLHAFGRAWAAATTSQKNFCKVTPSRVGLLLPG